MRELEIDSARLRCRTDGRPGTPVVVIVASAAGTLDEWHGLAQALTSRYRVVRVGLPGVVVPASPVEAVTCELERQARRLAVLLDELALERADLLGQGISGIAAQAFALAFPRRLHGMILVGTTPERLPERLIADGADDTSGHAGRLLDWPGFVDRLEQIVVSTLVIVGEADNPLLQRGAELLHGWCASRPPARNRGRETPRRSTARRWPF